MPYASSAERAGLHQARAYVFYDFETTENTKRSVRTNEHVPRLACLQ